MPKFFRDTFQHPDASVRDIDTDAVPRQNRYYGVQDLVSSNFSMSAD